VDHWRVTVLLASLDVPLLVAIAIAVNGPQRRLARDPLWISVAPKP
jgi:hypothetical protein